MQNDGPEWESPRDDGEQVAFRRSTEDGVVEIRFRHTVDRLLLSPIEAMEIGIALMQLAHDVVVERGIKDYDSGKN